MYDDSTNLYKLDGKSVPLLNSLDDLLEQFGKLKKGLNFGYLYMMQNSRLFSLDFLKFVAALMITNSHFQPLYEDVSPSLATFGVHGNALFFFVSGFLLMKGFEKKKSPGFLNWYKGRMRRLWPAVFIWVVVSALVWKQTLTIGNLLLFDGYWFLQAIAVAYVIYYFLARPLKLIWGAKLGRCNTFSFCL